MKTSTREALIKELNQDRIELEKKLKENTELKKMLQAGCEHEWKENGHDSHYEYEKCIICDLERKV